MRTVTLDDGEVVTAAQQAAGIVTGTGKTEYFGLTSVITLRLPLFTAIRLQALAHKSGKSRNAMACQLLDVGIEEVEKCLSEEVLREVQQIDSELLTSFMEDRK